MRYLVGVPDESAFREILSRLRKRTQVFVASEKRRYVSTGHIPKDLRQEIIDKGGEISEEIQYELDEAR